MPNHSKQGVQLRPSIFPAEGLSLCGKLQLPGTNNPAFLLPRSTDLQDLSQEIPPRHEHCKCGAYGIT